MLKEIPPSLLTECSELQNLNLSYNQIKVISDDIGRLRNLKELDMSHNLLRTIPDAIENCN